MNISIQVTIGIVCGIIFGLFAAGASISQKEKEMKNAWDLLVNALNIRYMKLKNVLTFLNRHMSEFSSEITSLITLCDEAIDMGIQIKNVKERLLAENQINYKLEGIKINMSNYPSLNGDEEVQKSIQAIAESEMYVGEAIRRYNSRNLEYRVFLETFPITFVAWIMNKNDDILPFSVTMAEEFDDNYVDEDEF